jgi:hypothetical protein
VGIWELERVSVRPAASAILWARHRDVICQTRTLAAPEAAATALSALCQAGLDPGQARR